MSNLLPSLSIANFLSQRDAVAERVRKALDLLDEAAEIGEAAGLGDPRYLMESTLRSRTFRACLRARDADVWMRALDANGWNHLMVSTGLRSFMDAKARDEWDTALRRGEAPPLTREAIEGTFAALYEARTDMFERGVITLFRGLSWNYRTNTPICFGKRVILRRNSTDGIDDLTRAMAILSGTPEPDYRNGAASLTLQARHRGESHAENAFVSWRWYLNGSIHCTFKRIDLIDRLNAILTKHFPGALPCPQGRRGT